MYTYKDPYIIDFTNVESYLHIHCIIREAMDWPDYYGCNWDAFWDLLTNMIGDPIHIEIRGFDNIEKNYPDSAEKMLKVLTRLLYYENKSYINDIRITLFRGDKKTLLS